jgi:uncharacterized protein with NAD-binding domain and iron-sulfur cluster
MRSEEVHTLILGTGLSGDAAGYTLSKAGTRPVPLEKDKVCGGLMRSIRRGDFTGMTSARLKPLAELDQFQNLYYVNRTETDIATLAGMEAAEDEL